MRMLLAVAVTGCSLMGPTSREPHACLETAAVVGDGIAATATAGLAGYAFYRSAHPNDEDVGSLATFGGSILLGLAAVEAVAVGYGIHELRACNQRGVR